MCEASIVVPVDRPRASDDRRSTAGRDPARVALLVSGFLAAAVGFGCSRKPADRDAAPSPAAEASEAAGPAESSPAGPAESLLPGVRALRFLPPDVVFVVAIDGLRGMAERIGLSRWIDRVRVVAAPQIDALASVLGQAPLSPAAFVDLGIDVDQPLGAALVLHEERAVLVVFGAVAEAGAFEAAAGRVAGNLGLAVVPRDALRARILALGDPAVLHLVLRDGLFFGVVGLPTRGSPGGAGQTSDARPDSGAPPPEDAGASCARRIATLEAEASLAASGRFRATFERFSFGRHASAYLDFGRWTEVAPRLSPARDPGSGDPVERIMAEAVRALERTGGRTGGRLDQMLESLDTVSVGLELVDRAVLLRVRAMLKPDSWLARLSPGGTGGTGGTLAWAPAERPVWLLHADMGREGLLLAAETALSLGDMTLDDLRANVAQAAGLDLDRDVLPLLTGAVSFAVTADLSSPFWEEVEPFRKVGLSLVVGLQDGEAATRFPLEALLRAPPFAGRTTPDGTTGGFVVDVPGWRPFHLDRVGTNLVVSTDPDLASAMASGASRPTFLDALDSPTLQELLRTPEAIALQIEDRAWFELVTAISVSPMFGGSPAAGPMRPNGPPAEDPLQREYDALSRQLWEMRRAHFWEKVRWQIARQRRFGSTAQALRIVPGIGSAGAVEIRGGWFPAEQSIPALIEGILEDDARWEERSRQFDAEEEPLDARVMELREALARAHRGSARHRPEEEIPTPAIAPP